ncbi:MAG: hypothetical protein R3C15_00370 [Thermoleophilia bacterium]
MEVARERSEPPARPVAGGRLLAVDAARTVAIVGMMAVHLAGEAADSWGALDWPSGFAAGGFAVLAGVSLGLTHRLRRPGWRPWAGQLARSALLFALGVGLAEISQGPVVILCVYAALFAVALPLRRLPPRVLLALGLVGTVVLPLVSYGLRTWLLDDPGMLRAVPPDYAVEWRTLTGEDAAVRVARTLLLDGIYPLLAWLPLALAGWGAYGVGLLRPERLGRLALVACALLALGFGGAALVERVTHVRAEAIAEVADAVPAALRGDRSPAELVDRGNGLPRVTGIDALLLAGHHTGTTLELWRILGVTAAFVVAFAALARVVPAAVAVAGWPGRIPLTVYSTHIAVGWVLVNGGLPEELTPTQEVVLLAAEVAAAFVLGAAYRGRRGPLEAVLAAVSRLAGGAAPARVRSAAAGPGP